MLTLTLTLTLTLILALSRRLPATDAEEHGWRAAAAPGT